MNTRTETLTPAQIEEIRRNDPEAEIYNVEYADVDYVPMDDLKRMMGTIRGIAKSLRDENPGWSDDQVRNAIISKSNEAKNMAETTHPRLFAMITSRDISDDRMETLAFMINLRERVESGEMTKEQSQTLLYAEMLQGHFK